MRKPLIENHVLLANSLQVLYLTFDPYFNVKRFDIVKLTCNKSWPSNL